MSKSRRLQTVPCKDNPEQFWEILDSYHYKIRKIVKTADGYYALPYMRVHKEDIQRVVRGEIPYAYSWKNKMKKVDVRRGEDGSIVVE